MNKCKSIALLLASIVFAGMLKAQTIEDGRKFLYYEKYKSAKETFNKLIAANPNDLMAIYWLGQTMITNPDATPKDLEDAKALYVQALEKSSNNALLIAGIGHVELHQGKAQDARQRFETALSLSQSKNPEVLKAIGVANADFDLKSGDPNYAIDKLKFATTLKGFKDPEVYCALGDAYRMLFDGGNAQTAYESALAINPNYVRALYRIGKIYQTQGPTQEELYMRYYNEAIAKDPAYGPVYENLYKLFYLTNVTESAKYLDKFLANTDDDPKNCYYLASMKYAQGLFNEAIREADGCIKANAEPYPNLYGVKAYAYDRLGDSVNAKAAFELYFNKQLPAKIGPTDLETYAKVLLKFPGNEELAGTYILKAVDVDSTEFGKVKLLNSMAGVYMTQKKYKEAADWYSKVVATKKEARKTDLYNAGYNYFRASEFNSAIGVFNQYTTKFPDDAFGFYMLGKANWAIDTTLDLALANPHFEKAITVGMADSVKYKGQLIGSYKYFVLYNAAKKKDNEAALAFCDRILSLDPNDAETISNKGLLSKPAARTPARPAGAATKPDPKKGTR
ncbi:MAG: hypothetical protein RLY16_1063 [Bacteroidota bacterium]|jgi:predicted Zn-dependent protease